MSKQPVSLWSVLLVGLVALLFVLPQPADARRRKKKPRPTTSAIAAMQPAGAEAGATGEIRIAMGTRGSVLTARFSGLEPSTGYAFAVDGQDRAMVLSDPAGNGAVHFQAPTVPAGGHELDFDPRTAVLALRRGGLAVLETSLSGTHSRSGVTASETAGIPAVQAAPMRAYGAAIYQVDSSGHQVTGIAAVGLDPGSYQVYVDGEYIGELESARSRKLAKRWRKNRRRRPQPTSGSMSVDSSTMGSSLDTLGAMVDIADGQQVMVSGPLLGGALGVSLCAETELERFLPRLSGVGNTKARLRTRDDCRRDFRVEIEDVAPGSYSLFVSGVLRGQIVAAADPLTGVVEGELEFKTRPDDPGELLLDFEPSGATVEVRQAGSVLFSGVFDAALPGTTGGAGPGGSGSCSEEEIRQAMAPTAQAPGADGDARFRTRDSCRQDFRVEAEDVPVGVYTLRVGGVNRGSFNVVVVPGGTEGEIEFDTNLDEIGELPLDFDPRGQTVEVLNAAGAVVLSTALGGTGGGAGVGSIACQENELRRLLLNAGVAPLGKADARHRVRDDCRRDFRVEVEDVATGSYRLRVAGVDRGPITVVSVAGGTEGEIEFDTHPDEAGERLLDFDPRGALVEVVQGGTVFFERVLD